MAERTINKVQQSIDCDSVCVGVCVLPLCGPAVTGRGSVAEPDSDRPSAVPGVWAVGGRGPPLCLPPHTAGTEMTGRTRTAAEDTHTQIMSPLHTVCLSECVSVCVCAADLHWKTDFRRHTAP